jgi:hypothetical protein
MRKELAEKVKRADELAEKAGNRLNLGPDRTGGVPLSVGGEVTLHVAFYGRTEYARGLRDALELVEEEGILEGADELIAEAKKFLRRNREDVSSAESDPVFSVGDRVVVREGFLDYGGRIGTVVEYRGRDDSRVEFDDYGDGVKTRSIANEVLSPVVDENTYEDG